jgi:MFS family permease
MKRMLLFVLLVLVPVLLFGARSSEEVSVAKSINDVASTVKFWGFGILAVALVIAIISWGTSGDPRGKESIMRVIMAIVALMLVGVILGAFFSKGESSRNIDRDIKTIYNPK